MSDTSISESARDLLKTHVNSGLSLLGSEINENGREAIDPSALALYDQVISSSTVGDLVDSAVQGGTYGFSDDALRAARDSGFLPASAGTSIDGEQLQYFTDIINDQYGTRYSPSEVGDVLFQINRDRDYARDPIRHTVAELLGAAAGTVIAGPVLGAVGVTRVASVVATPAVNFLSNLVSRSPGVVTKLFHFPASFAARNPVKSRAIRSTAVGAGTSAVYGVGVTESGEEVDPDEILDVSLLGGALGGTFSLVGTVAGTLFNKIAVPVVSSATGGKVLGGALSRNNISSLLKDASSDPSLPGGVGVSGPLSNRSVLSEAVRRSGDVETVRSKHKAGDLAASAERDAVYSLGSGVVRKVQGLADESLNDSFPDVTADRYLYDFERGLVAASRKGGGKDDFEKVFSDSRSGFIKARMAAGRAYIGGSGGGSREVLNSLRNVGDTFFPLDASVSGRNEIADTIIGKLGQFDYPKGTFEGSLHKAWVKSGGPLLTDSHIRSGSPLTDMVYESLPIPSDLASRYRGDVSKVLFDLKDRFQYKTPVLAAMKVRDALFDIKGSDLAKSEAFRLKRSLVSDLPQVAAYENQLKLIDGFETAFQKAYSGTPQRFEDVFVDGLDSVSVGRDPGQLRDQFYALSNYGTLNRVISSMRHLPQTQEVAISQLAKLFGDASVRDQLTAPMRVKGSGVDAEALDTAMRGLSRFLSATQKIQLNTGKISGPIGPFPDESGQVLSGAAARFTWFLTAASMFINLLRSTVSKIGSVRHRVAEDYFDVLDSSALRGKSPQQISDMFRNRYETDELIREILGGRAPVSPDFLGRSAGVVAAEASERQDNDAR